MSSFTKYDNSRPETWAEHLERFQFWLDSKGQITDDHKRGLLIEMLDDHTTRDLKDWITTNTLRDCTYIELVNILNKNIVPPINPMVCYNTFINRRQLPGEKAVVYMSKLWRLASSCNFEGMTATIVLYQFVCGLRNADLQAKLFPEKELTAMKALEVVQLVECSEKNVIEVRNSCVEDVHKIHATSSSQVFSPPSFGSTFNKKVTCFICAELGHTAAKFGHVTKVCKQRDKSALQSANSNHGSVLHQVPVELRTWASQSLTRAMDSVNHAGPWASAIVPVLKRNSTLRLCADYKATVNRALSSGGCIYGTIDLKEVYTQIPVNGNTSHMLTVNIIQGLHSVTQLPFGIKSASSSFQRIIDGLLGPVKGFTLLHILGDAGSKVNADKCVWQSASIEFLGFRFDAEGIHPTTDKTAAITNAPSPCTKQKLQSLLGLISFYGRFFKDKATILEPLHRFQQVLAHYNPDLPLVVTADASPVGVSAVLAHIVPDAQPGKTREIPIAYAFRTLSATEPAYSQLDREAIAIIFPIEKFTPYLAFHRFTIITDHKPLLDIFAPDRPILLHLSPQMLRWTIILSSFDYELCHKPGTAVGNADCLSKLPQPTPGEDVFLEPAGAHLLEASDLCLLSL
ncbi:hypothetical protein PR048_010930 [Dryococelus australis]|uniref:Reverse transcriptase RNase H-like domain-containing protein n=1 Tax=Dryococelus australis TaxID=614101 RepID=A0ABQ9HK70_9NEOP|nr:hypothetical protein PR048_010930 [Dryococelus australis]